MNVLSLPGYRIGETLHRSAASIIYRAAREDDALPVVIKTPAADYPGPDTLARYALAWDVGSKLQHNRIIRHIELLATGASKALVMEDFGASSLDRQDLEDVPIVERLEIAIAIAEGIAEIHRAGIIHKDIKPHNVVLNLVTRDIKIIDFDVASRLAREGTRAAPPSMLEGTLAYMAPEQSGRTNRSVDHRCDLYSLGVTLFELLAGHRPFDANDPLALLHQHLTRPAPELHQVDPAIPPTLSEVVGRLLAKAPEQRYQSAHGVTVDLVTCRDQLRRTANIEPFEIGLEDRRSHFDIPEKLYGRETEVAQLVATFRRVTRGGREVQWVCGGSGIGKSVLIKELHGPVLAAKGRFCSGKFEQFRRDIPYQALGQALRSLFRYILAEPVDRQDAVKRRLESHLAGQGGVIKSIVPEIESLLGPQTDPVDLPPGEARHRFERAFTQLIQALSAKAHPLVLFLDDLQWADQPSLELLQVLLTQPRTEYLAVIGAYRVGDPSTAHALTRMTRTLKESGVVATTLELGPLDDARVSALLSDTLLAPDEAVRPLAELIVSKTGGNPFFVREMLRRLYADGSITFEGGRWRWTLDEVAAAQITDNVVDLMTSRLLRFDERTQHLLCNAACIGGTFDLRGLSLIEGDPASEIARRLEAVLKDELIVPLDAGYRYAAYAPENAANPKYRFQHDRVQQAAHELKDEAERAATHLKIGRLALEATADDALDSNAVNIANHFLAAGSLIDQTERTDVARLHLRAAKRALAATAAEPATRYLQEGLRLLGPEGWRENYDLALDLHLRSAEAEYLRGRDEKVEIIAATLAENSKSVLDEVQLLIMQQAALSSRLNPVEAVDRGVAALGRLGHRLPRHPSASYLAAELLRTKHALGSKTPEQLAAMPLNPDPVIGAQVAILAFTTTSAVYISYEIVAAVTLQCIRMLATHGPVLHSPHAMSIGVMVQAALTSDFELAERWGRAGVKLAERCKFIPGQASAEMMRCGFAAHWTKPSEAVARKCEENWRFSVAAGQFLFASYAIVPGLQLDVLGGRNLGAVVDTMVPYLEWVRRNQQTAVDRAMSSWIQLAVSLTRTDAVEGRLAGEYFDIDLAPAPEDSVDVLGTITALVADGMLAVFCGNMERAARSFERARPYLPQFGTLPHLHAHNFFESLACCALERKSSARDAKRYRTRAVKNQRRLAKWIDKGATKFAGQYALVNAELERNSGHLDAALSEYKIALDHAQSRGLPHLEGLCCQRLADLFQERGLELAARTHDERARECFASWGASLIAQQSRAANRHVSPTSWPEMTSHLSGSVGTSASTRTSSLDVDTIVQASEAIASITRLEDLLARLVVLAAQNAGAQRCILLLMKDDELRVEALLDGPQDPPSLLTGEPYESARLASSVVRFVERTLEPVVVGDAHSDPRFASDPYVRDELPRSVLCVPVTNQSKLVGLLYLENNATKEVFTAHRVKMLEILSSQAAISIENARVYDNLESLVQTRTQQLAVATERANSASEAKSEFCAR